MIFAQNALRETPFIRFHLCSTTTRLRCQGRSQQLGPTRITALQNSLGSIRRRLKKIDTLATLILIRALNSKDETTSEAFNDWSATFRSLGLIFFFELFYLSLHKCNLRNIRVINLFSLYYILVIILQDCFYILKKCFLTNYSIKAMKLIVASFVKHNLTWCNSFAYQVRKF